MLRMFACILKTCPWTWTLQFRGHSPAIHRYHARSTTFRAVNLLSGHLGVVALIAITICFVGLQTSFENLLRAAWALLADELKDLQEQRKTLRQARVAKRRFFPREKTIRLV